MHYPTALYRRPGFQASQCASHLVHVAYEKDRTSQVRPSVVLLLNQSPKLSFAVVMMAVVEVVVLVVSSSSSSRKEDNLPGQLLICSFCSIVDSQLSTDM